jgi:hypothetical protein
MRNDSIQKNLNSLQSKYVFKKAYSDNANNSQQTSSQQLTQQQSTHYTPFDYTLNSMTNQGITK